ncbi:MAG: hypothetical protein Q4B28_01260 [bacterium]|nr:hypothetical protein [bacterium]
MKTDFIPLLLVALGSALIAYLIATLRFHQKIAQLRKTAVRQSRSTIL